ncbi:MAG: hypothetical protein JXA54_09240 [Candidatus Heimdallarchaeota archaeon]|nr:hypothetical protein [Candidatus Heimdallarchaeota archaeon]
MEDLDNTKKRKDFEQAFTKLVNKFNEFQEGQTIFGMERVEIEQLIQQINRLEQKLDKFIKIIGCQFNKDF